MANFEFVSVPEGMEGCVPCELCRNLLVFEAAKYFVKLLEGRCVDLEDGKKTFKVVDLNEIRGCFVCQKHAIVILRKAMPAPICVECHMKPLNMDPLIPVLVHDHCAECQAQIMIQLHYGLMGKLEKHTIVSANLNIVTLTCEDSCGYLCEECDDTAVYAIVVVESHARNLKMHKYEDCLVCPEHAISLLQSAMNPVIWPTY